MRRLAVLALGILSTLAVLAQPYTCLPKEFGGSGAYYTRVDTGAAVAYGTVCPPLAASSPIQGLVHLTGFVPGASCAGGAPAAAASAALSPDPVAVVNTFVAACASVPASGSADRAALDAAYQQMVTQIQAKWAADHPPAGPIYKTQGATQRVYIVSPSGACGPSVAPITAPPNSLCDCTRFSTSVGSSKYCSLAGGAASQCTYCVKIGP
jgi:hypothetical protein